MRLDGGGGYVMLVKPGGKVVQVRGPVRAGDVMHSTQHYVTRPDVFQISAHAALLTPDAILMPGHKFFLVTYHTMARWLIKEEQERKERACSAPREISPSHTALKVTITSTKGLQQAPIDHDKEKEGNKGEKRKSLEQLIAKVDSIDASEEAAAITVDRCCWENIPRRTQEKPPRSSRGKFVPTLPPLPESQSFSIEVAYGN